MQRLPVIAGVVLCFLTPGGLKGVEACKGKTEEVKTSQERGPGDLLLIDSSTNPKVLRLPEFRPLEGCSVPPFPLPVDDTVSGTLDGNLVICGGTNTETGYGTVECDVLKDGEWGEMPTMIKPRASAASSMTGKGMWVSAGRDTSSIEDLRSTEFLSEGKWELGPDLPKKLYGHCQVTAGSDVYIFGGSTGYAYVDTGYKLEGDEWKELPKMKTKRAYHACAVLGNSIYVIGGHEAETSVQRFDVSSLTWVEEKEITPGIKSRHAVVFDSAIYLIGRKSKQNQADIFKLTLGSGGEIGEQEFLTQIDMASKTPHIVSASEIGC